MIVIVIISVVVAIFIPALKDKMKEHKGDLKEIVATGKEIVSAKPSNESRPVESAKPGKDICIEGCKKIMIGNQMYYLATIDDWGDLQPIPCK